MRNNERQYHGLAIEAGEVMRNEQILMCIIPQFTKTPHCDWLSNVPMSAKIS